MPRVIGPIVRPPGQFSSGTPGAVVVQCRSSITCVRGVCGTASGKKANNPFAAIPVYFLRTNVAQTTHAEFFFVGEEKKRPVAQASAKEE